MIVATTQDGVQFYSNDAQLFSDGEVTIYSPASLPDDVELASTELRVSVTHTKGMCTVQVSDATSGYVFKTVDDLSVAEAGEYVQWAIIEFAEKE